MGVKSKLEIKIEVGSLKKLKLKKKLKVKKKLEVKKQVRCKKKS